jgi:hypothetical protein
MDTDEVFYSRCNVGKRGWFWIAFRFADGPGEWLDLIAEGVEPTAAGAEAKAGEAAGPKARMLTTHYASYECKKRAAIRRMARPAIGKGSAPIEYAWNPESYYSDGDSDGRERWIMYRHRIVKKTARRVYVRREPEYEPRDLMESRQRSWADYQEQTLILDRAKFESRGCASWHKKYDHRIFYSTKEGAEAKIREIEDSWRRISSPGTTTPSWALSLGLAWPATADEVKAAYREKAKALHPDAGGDAERFVALQQAYESAMRWCDGPGPAAPREGG